MFDYEVIYPLHEYLNVHEHLHKYNSPQMKGEKSHKNNSLALLVSGQWLYSEQWYLLLYLRTPWKPSVLQYRHWNDNKTKEWVMMAHTIKGNNLLCSGAGAFC